MQNIIVFSDPAGVIIRSQHEYRDITTQIYNILKFIKAWKYES